jgi:carboxylesterase type B
MPSDKDGPSPPLQGPEEFTPKVTMKGVGKSMFDNKPKKPTPQEFQQKVQQSQEKLVGYNKRAAELYMQFQRAIADKTLAQNRNVFAADTEREMLQNLLQLASEINEDPNEQESRGSLTLVILLLKTALAQRDRINELEYALVTLQRKFDGPALTEYINKEISKALDKKKGSE